MDEDREIRFLIPPFFFYASLFSWMFIDPYLHCWLANVTGGTWKDLLPILAAAGAATIPLGYAIGTFGVWILTTTVQVRLAYLRLRGRPEPRQIYEAWLSSDPFLAIISVTKAHNQNQGEGRPDLLYAAATFDHELLPKGIHEWLRRRFNAFMVGFNSVLALGISGIIVAIRAAYSWPFERACGLSETQWQEQTAVSLFGSKFWWLVLNLLVILLLARAASKAWVETMGMIEFQAQRAKLPSSQSEGASNQHT